MIKYAPLQGYKDDSTYTNIMHHINKHKNKNHMTLLIDAENIGY